MPIVIAVFVVAAFACRVRFDESSVKASDDSQAAAQVWQCSSKASNSKNSKNISTALVSIDHKSHRYKILIRENELYQGVAPVSTKHVRFDTQRIYKLTVYDKDGIGDYNYSHQEQKFFLVFKKPGAEPFLEPEWSDQFLGDKKFDLYACKAAQDRADEFNAYSGITW